MRKDNKSYENKLSYIRKYNKDTYRTFCFMLNKEKDLDIIHKLDSCPNKMDYVRKLILEDMGR